MKRLEVESLARRTVELCNIPSAIGSEKAVCDHLERWAAGLFPPDAIRRLGNNLVVGQRGGDAARPKLALLGHLDTVPGEAAPATVTGDRIVGLGSSDMKGGLALMMAAAEATRGQLGTWGEVVFVFYDREEGPYPDNGLETVHRHWPELLGLRLAICLEPTDGEVQLGCLGGLHAWVTFAGKAAHSARPWQGENAIHRAGPLLSRLEGRERVRVMEGGLEFFEVLSATLVKGGAARNVVPDRCELNLNYRFAPGKSLEVAEQELRAFVGPGPGVEIVDRSPAGRVCRENPWVAGLIGAAGGQATSKQAWTDVGRLSAWGVDAVNFGPGETAQAHQANESCSISLLQGVARKLERFLEGLQA